MKVSVIMPTYNRAYIIEQAMKSVLQQSFPEWELIIVDDGSTDATEEIVKKYVNQRIRYVRLVSNHGGRVLDQCAATAEVLPEICDALADENIEILVDGGIRSGADVFKALAIGADAVIIARPFVNSLFGGGAEGVRFYTEKIRAELEDVMMMCGAASLKDINRAMIRL